MKLLHKLTRPQMLLWAALAAVWVPVFIVYPVTTYNHGTSRDISVEAVTEPYIDSPVLSYRWTGDVYRSCDISLRRYVVDSQGYRHTLVESPLITAPPRSTLGMQSFLIEVQIGRNLPEGPAVYFAHEIPRCTWLQRLWPIAIDYPPVTFNVTRLVE